MTDVMIETASSVPDTPAAGERHGGRSLRERLRHGCGAQRPVRRRLFAGFTRSLKEPGRSLGATAGAGLAS